MELLLVLIAAALVGYGMFLIHPGLLLIGVGFVVYRAALALRKD